MLWTRRKRSRRRCIPAGNGLLRKAEGSGDGEVDGVDGIVKVPRPVEVGTGMLDGVEVGGPAVSRWLRFQNLRLRDKRRLGWEVCRQSLSVFEGVCEGAVRMRPEGESAGVEAKSREKQVGVIW